jgi:hypothetical protein
VSNRRHGCTALTTNISRTNLTLPPEQPPPAVHRLTRVLKPSSHVRQITSREGMTGSRARGHGGQTVWPTWQVCQDGTADDSVPAADEPEELGNKATEPVFHAGLEGIIAAAAALDTDGDLHSISDAQSHSNWPHWKEAMDKEIQMLEEAGTWETVPCPADQNIVGSKWVFQVNCKQRTMPCTCQCFCWPCTSPKRPTCCLQYFSQQGEEWSAMYQLPPVFIFPCPSPLSSVANQSGTAHH